MSESLRQLLAPVVESLGFELWHLEMVGGGTNGLLRVYIDHENGIDLNDCERVSREISAVMDVEDPLQSRYRLEVSSPGLDRPLVTQAHFERFVGEQVRVTLYAPIEGSRKYKGVLTGVDSGELRLNCDGVVVNVPLGSIAKARLDAV